MSELLDLLDSFKYCPACGTQVEKIPSRLSSMTVLGCPTCDKIWLLRPSGLALNWGESFEWRVALESYSHWKQSNELRYESHFYHV